MSFTPKPVYLKKAPSDWADNNEVEPQSFMYVGPIEGVESLSPEEIAGAVTDYLTENPPEVGGTVALEDVEGLGAALNAKADTEHTHAIEDVEGLADALDGVTPGAHTHVAADITDFADAVADAVGDIPAGDHTHDITDVTGLQDALDEKLDASEVASSLTGTSDTSVVRRVAGRIKAETGVDGDDVVNVSQLEDALEGYAEVDHDHGVEDINGLSTALSAKADTSALSGYVPTSRTVAGKALSSNVTLTASDVGAVPTTRTVAGKALSDDITLAASDVGAVPTTRTVNGQALSGDVTLTASDVSAVPTTRTVNGAALSSNVTLTASQVGALPLATSRPVIPATAANTWPTRTHTGLPKVEWDHSLYGTVSTLPSDMEEGDFVTDLAP